MSAVILSAIGSVLDEIAAAILSDTGVPNVWAWDGRSTSWKEMLTGPLAAIIERIIRHILSLGGYVASTAAYARQHLQLVQSRLRDWPVTAWAHVRDALDAGIAAGDDSRALRERVGDALDVTALTRTTEAEMERLYDRIEAGVSPAEEAALRARIRDLAGTADRSRRQWEWRADRIARTETAGAVNAGVDAFAAASGRDWWRQWWSSLDERVRATHVVAHGQIVPPGARFSVGAGMLRWPGDPLGPPGEVINCRCSTLLLSEKEARGG